MRLIRLEDAPDWRDDRFLGIAGNVNVKFTFTNGAGRDISIAYNATIPEGTGATSAVSWEDLALVSAPSGTKGVLATFASDVYIARPGANGDIVSDFETNPSNYNTLPAGNFIGFGCLDTTGGV